MRAAFPPAPPPVHQNGFIVVAPDPQKRDEILKGTCHMTTWNIFKGNALKIWSLNYIFANHFLSYFGEIFIDMKHSAAQQTLNKVSRPKTNLRCANKLGSAPVPRTDCTEQQRRQTALANARKEVFTLYIPSPGCQNNS